MISKEAIFAALAEAARDQAELLHWHMSVPTYKDVYNELGDYLTFHSNYKTKLMGVNLFVDLEDDQPPYLRVFDQDYSTRNIEVLTDAHP